MASQAPGEPSDRRSSGRKRNADTYRKTATPPFEVKRVTLSSERGAQVDVEVNNDNETGLSQSTTLTFAKKGRQVTVFIPAYAYTANGVSVSVIGFSGGPQIPLDMRPYRSGLCAMPYGWNGINAQTGSLNFNTSGYLGLRVDGSNDNEWAYANGVSVRVPGFYATWFTA